LGSRRRSHPWSRLQAAEFGIIIRKQIEAAEDPEATRKEMVDNFKRIIDPYIAAGNDTVDDIIDPRETRPRIVRGLEMAATKRVERPWKKHGVCRCERSE
jgi:propionyl-CoA carboxylase beta chain